MCAIVIPRFGECTYYIEVRLWIIDLDICLCHNSTHHVGDVKIPLLRTQLRKIVAQEHFRMMTNATNTISDPRLLTHI